MNLIFLNVPFHSFMDLFLSDEISRNWYLVDFTRGPHFTWEGLFRLGCNVLMKKTIGPNKWILPLEDLGRSYKGRDFYPRWMPTDQDFGNLTVCSPLCSDHRPTHCHQDKRITHATEGG